jgi:hypothetical protein
MKGQSWIQTQSWATTTPTWGCTITTTTSGTDWATLPAPTRWFRDGLEVPLPRPQVQHFQTWGCDECGQQWTQVDDDRPPVLPPAPFCFAWHKHHFCSPACLQAAEDQETCQLTLLQLQQLPDLLPARRPADKE